MSTGPSRVAGQWIFAVCGLWMIGLGGYFIFLRPTLLPEDLRYTGADLRTLLLAAPHLAIWLDKVFMVMGGFMAGAGTLVLFIAGRALPMRLPGTVPILLIAGALTVGLMSAVNFALDSDFKWVLVLPPVMWIAGLLLMAKPQHEQHRLSDRR